MNAFLSRHRDKIVGVLRGFDRVLFRGTLMSLAFESGMAAFLNSRNVLLKNFGPFVQSVSKRLQQHAEHFAEQHGRRYQYVSSPQLRKEDLVKGIAEEDGITEGLVCVLACVEPCDSFSVRGDKKSAKLRIVREQRKCLFLYFYFIDREFGLIHVRLQTWFPLSVQVCVNGREWLARQLDQRGI